MTCRWATYSQGGFKEGVSLTVDDELNRWQKYAYGCNECVFLSSLSCLLDVHAHTGSSSTPLSNGSTKAPLTARSTNSYGALHHSITRSQCWLVCRPPIPLMLILTVPQIDMFSYCTSPLARIQDTTNVLYRRNSSLSDHLPDQLRHARFPIPHRRFLHAQFRDLARYLCRILWSW